jgi:hypothetical protein
VLLERVDRSDGVTELIVTKRASVGRSCLRSRLRL